MNKFKDNEDQTFVIKILDDLRSNNRPNSLGMQYETSLGFSTSNDSLLSNKRRRSCSPELQDSMLSKYKLMNSYNNINT